VGKKKVAKKVQRKQPTLKALEEAVAAKPARANSSRAQPVISEPKSSKRPITQYDHADKLRANNPPVGLVTPATDPPEPPKKTYAYDPHLDPQLIWAGKAERLSFDVDVVSLHVHERIDPMTIIQAVRTDGHSETESPASDTPLRQRSLFEEPKQNPPLRDALDFYRHPQGWSNRLVAGDSLLVMNSLLEKEGMAGKVQMAYIDPPYGIRYRSNFQPFTSKNKVKDKDEDLTQEPETLKAFRDTWQLGVHSYLTSLRDRLRLVKELLTDSGSCFVQISDENLHHVREILDEVFGPSQFASMIAFAKGGGGLSASDRPSSRFDYLVWYAKDASKIKYRRLYERRDNDIESGFGWVQLPNGDRRKLTRAEKDNPAALPAGSRIFGDEDFTKPGPGSKYEIKFNGESYDSGKRWWGMPKERLQRVLDSGRAVVVGQKLRYVRFVDESPGRAIDNFWDGLGGASEPVYVVQTNATVTQRCLLMTTDPGDLVIDPTCGSGTTAVVAEQWGRRWITCDTSRVATTLAKQRLMTASFPYYRLAHEHEGVSSGFLYETVPHVTKEFIADCQHIKPGMTQPEIDEALKRYGPREPLFDRPKFNNAKVRVTGPFTVEAVPAVTVVPVDDIHETPASDSSVARSGATARQDQWLDELFKTGVRGKQNQMLRFARLEPLPGFKCLQAVGESEPNGHGAKRVAVSFGPEHAPLEQRQVEMAWEEARVLTPKPDVLLFAAFQFDPEAAKDIDELTSAKTGLTFLKAQMNTDLLTEDLKKKRASNESFWLIGQPDVSLRSVKQKGKGKDKPTEAYVVEVHGFDYYNPVTGKIDSGDTQKIAMWLLDTDYDGRSLFPRQVFFPMSGPKDGWSRLAKNLKAEIDEDLIEAYRGTESLPFTPGKYRRVAVKIVDDRGIESLKVIGF
jgi:adenine-specific DNA-methyltransferase